MTSTKLTPTIHQFTGSAIPVNAYLIETETGVVAVDSTLTVSDSTALRAKLETLHKPLLAVIITHAHPDHYAGLTQLVKSDDVPILAVAGVDAAIRRDDALKDQILTPMFGEEWPQRRTFPNQIVHDGEQVTFGGLTFTVKAIGPAESPHDSLWLLSGEKAAFIGDLAYNHMHAYLADGHYQAWLDKLSPLQEMLGPDRTLYLGHGAPGFSDLLTWQATYIRTFIEAVRAVKDEDAQTRQARVTGKMQDFLPTEALLFLMQLSIEPVAAQLNNKP